MNTIHNIILRKTLEGNFVYQKKINKLLLHGTSAYHEAKGKIRKAHLSQINQWFYIKDQEQIRQKRFSYIDFLLTSAVE